MFHATELYGQNGRYYRHLAMIFPSRSQLTSKQITRTGRAEAVTKEGLAATLLPARQPDRMGQRHSLRSVRPRSRSDPSETREMQFRKSNFPRNDAKTQGFRSIATRTPGRHAYD